jgi:hypothetical protein
MDIAFTGGRIRFSARIRYCPQISIPAPNARLYRPPQETSMQLIVIACRHESTHLIVYWFFNYRGE